MGRFEDPRKICWIHGTLTILFHVMFELENEYIYIYGTPFLVALYKDMGRKVNHHQCTSSTAQGGGGSFKNRKPIGEVGCCESGMAERSH